MYKSIIKPGLFCYAIPVTTVPANGQASPEINISNDSDFMLMEIRSTLQDPGQILVAPRVSSGELFSNVNLDTRLFAETSYPVRLAQAVKIPRNTTLVIQLTNTTPGDLDHQIQFWGYKVTPEEK